MMGYSMSKTITAAAAMQLVQDRKLGLNNPVADYIGALPYDGSITVHQLLSHTSGIPNPIPLRWVHLTAQHQQFDERAALDARLARWTEMPSAQDFPDRRRRDGNNDTDIGRDPESDRRRNAKTTQKRVPLERPRRSCAARTCRGWC